MINTPPLFKGLNLRISIKIPIKGRGFINQGVYITALHELEQPWEPISAEAADGLAFLSMETMQATCTFGHVARPQRKKEPTDPQ